MATRRTPPTSPGLLAEARHLVLPTGIVSSGFPSVQATCAQIGLLFDPWQCDMNRCILAKDAHGLYAADTVVISISRQVGKTFDIGALVFADCIINPGTTTVWTAHRFKVARETFDSLRAMAKSPLLAAHIDFDAITSAAGNECIPFRNGSRIVFAARERGAIRGFTKVRRLVLDEAQILSESALADMVPTMNQAENPQIILMGTPPKPNDPSEVFSNLRREALAGTSEGVLYVEFSAPAGSDPDDRAAWRAANPSFPRRTPAKAILRMKKLLGVDDFRREGLGIWDDLSVRKSGIDPTDWSLCADPESRRDGSIALGITQSPDRSTVSIAILGKRADGDYHGELIEHRVASTSWVPRRVRELVDRHKPVSVKVDPIASGLIKDLENEGIDVDVVTAGDFIAGCGRIYDMVRATAHPDEVAEPVDGEDGVEVKPLLRLWHRDQKDLNDAVKSAVMHKLARGFVWRPGGDESIEPLGALTLALIGFEGAEHADPLSNIF